MPFQELASRIQSLDKHVVIIDPSFDGGPSWDIPTLDQLKNQQRLSAWHDKKNALKYDGAFNTPSLARELRIKSALAYLQPFIETGVALGIYTDRILRVFS